MFWRPVRAIPSAQSDGNRATEPDPAWQPLRPTPNFPEYPSAHACHTSAVTEALRTFFGTDRVRFSLDSRVTGTVREYSGFREALREVNRARVLQDLKVPPGNRLEALRGNRKGQFSIRINDQWRICFRWRQDGVHDVEIVDYH